MIGLLFILSLPFFALGWFRAKRPEIAPVALCLPVEEARRVARALGVDCSGLPGMPGKSEYLSFLLYSLSVIDREIEEMGPDPDRFNLIATRADWRIQVAFLKAQVGS